MNNIVDLSGPIMITGAALDLVKGMADEGAKCNDEVTKLANECNAKIDELTRANRAREVETMGKIAAEMGIPADAAPHFMIDAKYLKVCGHAYLMVGPGYDPGGRQPNN